MPKFILNDEALLDSLESISLELHELIELTRVTTIIINARVAHIRANLERCHSILKGDL
jgi:hypothetical protein